MQWLKAWLRKWLGIESADDQLSRNLVELCELSSRLDGMAQFGGVLRSETQKLTAIESEFRHAQFQQLRELIAATGENFGLRLDEISRRVIDLETEPAGEAPKHKDEDDPLSGSGSWSAVAASIERANGIR